MKATAQSLTSDAPAEKARNGVLSDLFKARLTTLVLLTTAIGFYLGSAGSMNWLLLLNALVGLDARR